MQTTFNIQPNMRHTTGFAVQQFESPEALLMLVLRHHECIHLDAHAIPLAKTVGRSVCHSVARKSGHVGMIFTSKQKHISIITCNLKFFRISGDHFLLAPVSCCMVWQYGTCKFPPPWTFLNSRSFRPRRSEADASMLADYGLVLRCPPKKWIKLEIMRHPRIMSWIGLGIPISKMWPPVSEPSPISAVCPNGDPKSGKICNRNFRITP